MAKKRQLKTGVKAGDGPPPGYFWSVGILDFAYQESRELLSASQYQHMAMQVKEIAACEQPTACQTVDIKPLDQIYEIRDKGGPLGGLNIRLFFGVDADNRIIVILGVIKKQNSGKTPLGDKVTMCRRWRKYLAGDYGKLTA